RPSSGFEASTTFRPCSDSNTSSAVRTAGLSSISRTVGIRERALSALCELSELRLDEHSQRGGGTIPWRRSFAPPLDAARGVRVAILHGACRYSRWYRGGAPRRDEDRELPEDPHAGNRDQQVAGLELRQRIGRAQPVA